MLPRGTKAALTGGMRTSLVVQQLIRLRMQGRPVWCPVWDDSTSLRATTPQPALCNEKPRQWRPSAAQSKLINANNKSSLEKRWTETACLTSWRCLSWFIKINTIETKTIGSFGEVPKRILGRTNNIYYKFKWVYPKILLLSIYFQTP